MMGGRQGGGKLAVSGSSVAFESLEGEKMPSSGSACTRDASFAVCSTGDVWEDVVVCWAGLVVLVLLRERRSISSSMGVSVAGRGVFPSAFVLPLNISLTPNFSR